MERRTSKELIDLYMWLDQIPLSRPKRNITRDFSDGVMAAEVVKHFFPRLVDLYNYTPTNSISQKHSNWDCLNRKVLCKLNFCVSKELVNRIVLNTAGAVEPILITLKVKIQKKLEQNAARKQNLRDINTRNDRSPQREISQVENHFAQPGGENEKYEETSIQNFRLEKSEILTYKDLSPSVQTLLCQKDQHILLLQNRLNQLEGLLQLKDKQIEMLKNPPKTSPCLSEAHAENMPLLEQLPIQSFPNGQKTDSPSRTSGRNAQCSVSCTTNMELNQQVSKQTLGNWQKTDFTLITTERLGLLSVPCTTNMGLSQQFPKQTPGNWHKTLERNWQSTVPCATNMALNQQVPKQTLGKWRKTDQTIKATNGRTNKEELENLYKWFDEIPLSRPIKNISRDFSDGVLAAQIVKHFFPKLVYLHNYVPSHCTQQKRSNWDFLNRNVFSKLNFCVSRDSVNKITLNTAGVIVPVLGGLRDKIKKALEDKKVQMLGQQK